MENLSILSASLWNHFNNSYLLRIFFSETQLMWSVSSNVYGHNVSRLQMSVKYHWNLFGTKNIKHSGDYEKFKCIAWRVSRVTKTGIWMSTAQ